MQERVVQRLDLGILGRDPLKINGVRSAGNAAVVALPFDPALQSEKLSRPQHFICDLNKRRSQRYALSAIPKILCEKLFGRKRLVHVNLVFDVHLASKIKARWRRRSPKPHHTEDSRYSALICI